MNSTPTPSSQDLKRESTSTLANIEHFAGDLALKANIYHDIAGASDIAGIVAIGDSDGAN